MSKEIKFRAWKKENSPEMIHIVSSIDWVNKEISFRYRLNSWTFRDDKESLDNIILMQYTGLKDKKGVEIYEGDILKLPTFNNQGWFKKAVVTFEDGSFQCDCNLVSKYNVEHIEVIGNIYENPELLEVSK